jgi:hypothetical protein
LEGSAVQIATPLDRKFVKQSSSAQLLAKMASNIQKPDGLTILPIEKLSGVFT